MEEKDVYELAKQGAEANGHELEEVTITQGDSQIFGGNEKTIYDNDALNKTIYGDGQTNVNIYDVGNTDLYGGALHGTTIYNVGQNQEQADPQVEPVHAPQEQAAQGNAGQGEIEAQKAAMIEEMRARREQERNAENERGR